MNEAQQETIATIANKFTYLGSGFSVASWFASLNWGVIGGLAVGIVGLLVNWHYKAKQDRREQAEFEKRMSK